MNYAIIIDIMLIMSIIIVLHYVSMDVCAGVGVRLTCLLSNEFWIRSI